MANLKDLIVNGDSRFIGKIYAYGGIVENGTELVNKYAPKTHSHSNATASAAGYMSAADKSKLDGIAASANNYTHPSAHAATMITQDATHRFVTDTEKSTWNGKANGSHTHNYAGSSSAGGAANSLAGFKVSTTTNIGIDSTDLNQAIGYVGGLTKATWNGNQSDGALYRQTYSASWVHQIFGDYRTGQLAVRGRNNGTWTAWRVVLDSTNYTNYAPTKTGTGASGNWAIGITGNAATATKATQDSAGQQINTTYIKNATVSGKVITFTKGNGTTFTLTTQDTNTTYGTATKSVCTSRVTKYKTYTSTVKTIDVSASGIGITLSGKTYAMNLYINGIRLTQGLDYTISGNTITCSASSGWVYDTAAEPQATRFEFDVYFFENITYRV